VPLPVEVPVIVTVFAGRSTTAVNHAGKPLTVASVALPLNVYTTLTGVFGVMEKFCPLPLV
jgi:hypothetical protein